MAEDDPRKAAAIADFVTTNKAIKYLSRLPELSPLQAAIIQYLALINPGATPGEIAQEYELESPHVAKVLKSLKESGHVHPVPDEKDGRVRHYWNTLKGSEVASGAMANRGYDIPAKSLPHLTISKPKIRGT